MYLPFIGIEPLGQHCKPTRLGAALFQHISLAWGQSLRPGLRVSEGPKCLESQMYHQPISRSLTSAAIASGNWEWLAHWKHSKF